MAQSNYKITLVPKGKEAAWRDRWINGKGGTDPGRTVHIKAKNLAEAKSKAREQNPSCTIMDEGSARLGSA